MNYFDIAILVVLGLFLIFGFVKGFIKTGLSLLSWGVGIALIYFVGKQVGELLTNSFIGEWISGGYNGLLEKLGEAGGYNVIKVGEELKLQTTNGQIIELSVALQSIGIPSFLHSVLGSALIVNETLSVSLNHAMTLFTCIAIGSVLLLIVVGIVFKIIGIFINRAMRVCRLKFVDRLFGGILHIAVGILFVSVIMLAIDLMSGLGFMEKVIAQRDAGVISKLFVEYNPISLILGIIGIK